MSNFGCKTQPAECVQNALSGCDCLYGRFLIHQCDIEVEISCKEKPRKIRKLEKGGGFVDPVKLYYHNDNDGNEKEKPDKGEGISLKIEEYNAPEKVYDKIYAEDLNCV